MAFDPKKLYRVATWGSNADWVYRDDANDGAAAADTAGYFNAAADILRVGDTIRRVSSSAVDSAKGTITTVATVGFHTVSANSGGVVDVNDTLAITATDTD